MVRAQAAFHSALLMCVSRSQNPMQSASDFIRLPARLAPIRLGLPRRRRPATAPGWAARTASGELCLQLGERGAMGASSGSGAAIADGGVTRSGGGGDGEVSIAEIDRAAAARRRSRVAIRGCDGGAMDGLGPARHRR